MERQESSRRIAPEEVARQKEFMHRIAQLPIPGRMACVQTYGCQQNENDSRRICGMLREMGFCFTEDLHQADLILFNTCAVRENAELKVFGKVGALKHYKKRKPSLKIALCGCMTQQSQVAQTLRRKYPHVDLVFGTHALYRFPELLYRVYGEERVFDTENSDGAIAEELPILRDSKIKAGVSVMYGCNNFCSYCIVPYVRGRERSRSREDVLAEVRAVAEQGITEVMLLGQNVNSYAGGCDFADLLRETAQVPGLRRIRFMTSHPKDISEKLVAVMAEYPNICNQLHLPFQSGSDRILKRMNRHYDRAHYLELIQMVRRYLPEAALSSDVIVGFPGETEEDFQETLSLVEQVRFDSLFTFLYSKRQGTPAAEYPDSATEEEKTDRFQRLLELQNRISREINETFTGKVEEVLVEGPSKHEPGTLAGRTEGNKLVHFTGSEELTGQYVPVKITEAQTWSLTGRIKERG